MARDRFDHSVDHSDVTRPAVQRVEVITGVERRRRWTVREKLTIVAESMDRCRPVLAEVFASFADGLSAATESMGRGQGQQAPGPRLVRRQAGDQIDGLATDLVAEHPGQASPSRNWKK